MDPVSLHFYSESYPCDFWRHHDVVAGPRPTQLFTVARARVLALEDHDSLEHTPSEQADARNLVHAHLRALKQPCGPRAFMVAGQNVAAFNKTYSDAEPLDHTSLRADRALAQVAQGLFCIEQHHTQRADESDSVQEQILTWPGIARSFEQFIKTADTRRCNDLFRLSNKYGNLLLPLAGAALYISTLQDAFDRTRQSLPETLVPGLRGVQRACKRLRQQLNVDLSRHEVTLNCAAPILRAAASPPGQQSAPPRSKSSLHAAPLLARPDSALQGKENDAGLEAWFRDCLRSHCKPGEVRSLPNLFGPGILHHLDAVQAANYALLCHKTVADLSALRDDFLGPTMTQVQVVETLCSTLLRRHAAARKPPQL